MNSIPTHVAIIMDGNGRWAKGRGLPRIAGHAEGAKRAREIVRLASDAGVKFLTLYAFSQENWNRPALEVDFLMQLLKRELDSALEEIQANNARFQTIGEVSSLPASIQKTLERFTEETSRNTGLTITLALSYSSRAEIVRAARCLAEEVAKKNILSEQINEELFSRYLYTHGMPDPDLLIRTSGELRISNFLLWQLSYSELYITDVYWPDFKKDEFLKALEDYGTRERRFGRLKPAH